MLKTILFMLTLTLSCAHQNSADYKTVVLGKGLLLKTDKFLDIFPANTKIVQLVVYSRNSEEQKAQVIFIKREALEVIVLSPLGVELLSLRVSKSSIERIGGIASFNLEFFHAVMRDMLAVYGSKTLLLDSIIGEAFIVENERERIISFGGQQVVSVRFSAANVWKSDIWLEHHQLSYQLKIEALEFEDASIR